MFADRGYEAVTLREIAKEIGYTHAVIYQHFPGKWHILAELSRETIGLMVQNFDAIAAKHLSPKERLFATSRGLIQFCTAHPQQFRNIFFGPENRNGVRAGQYINDIGAPLFGRFVQLFFDVAKVRHTSGLLFDRRPRARTRNRCLARCRKDRSARVESACRRPTFGQVQPDAAEAHRLTPHRLRLSHCGQRADLEYSRRDGSNRESARM
jgi:AcrR family transcriptional regulator